MLAAGSSGPLTADRRCPAAPFSVLDNGSQAGTAEASGTATTH